jgi:hypothetical protein
MLIAYRYGLRAPASMCSSLKLVRRSLRLVPAESANWPSSEGNVPGAPAHALACDGYKLANDGHDTRSLAHYLGHGSLLSTARHTALAPDRFKGFWKD